MISTKLSNISSGLYIKGSYTTYNEYYLLSYLSTLLYQSKYDRVIFLDKEYSLPEFSQLIEDTLLGLSLNNREHLVNQFELPNFVSDMYQPNPESWSIEWKDLGDNHDTLPF